MTRVPRPGPAWTLCALAGLLAVAGLEALEGPTPWVAPSTREMAALLAERVAAVDPMKVSVLLNTRRAATYAERLEWPRPFGERLTLRHKYTKELLNSGQLEKALETLDGMQQDVEKNAPGAWKDNAQHVLILRAMAYLRMAEEQNCHLNNNRDACLLPIKGEGVHQRREGATRAIQVLEETLALQPQNLQARWLLNVAHMTLGSYPEGVAPAQLIPPSAFAAEYPLPRFDNVAREAGVAFYGLAGGAILDDFDNDGRLDLMTSAMGYEDPMRFFHNKGDGTFEDRTATSGLQGEKGGLNMVHADYDNDGFVDVLVLRGGWMGSEGRFPLSLLRNNGNGTFTDVTRAAGLLRFAPTQTAAFLDFDGDGWLDLFVGNETNPAEPWRHPCHLFHSNRDGTFTDVAKETGVDFVGFVKGVATADYDNDGRPDLYLSVLEGDNVLFHNDGPVPGADGRPGWRFGNATARAGVKEPRYSFGTFFFDYDNDGWQDLFVVGYGWAGAADVAADYLGLPTPAERGRLYHNRGNGTFEDVTKAMGLYKVIPAMGHNFGDLDNDGYLDFYLGTGNPDLSSLVPNRMFRNAEGRVFQDVTTAGNFGHLQKGHAVCFGDVDNDGDQDIFEVMGGAHDADQAWSALYRNPGNANRSVVLELQGVRSNRSALGARIKVTVETKKGPRSIYRTVSEGGSFGGSPLRQEIGLGDASRISSVEVLWPVTGQTQTFENLKPGRRYHIREDEAAARTASR